MPHCAFVVAFRPSHNGLPKIPVISASLGPEPSEAELRCANAEVSRTSAGLIAVDQEKSVPGGLTIV